MQNSECRNAAPCPNTDIVCILHSAFRIARRASPHSRDDQKSTWTLNRMNRGSSTAVGCIHRAPFVAGSYTVSYVVAVLELNRLYRSRPTFVFVLPNRRTFAKRMSTTLMRSPYR